MKILALEKEIPGVTAEQFLPYLKAEAEQVWNLYKAGVIREIYFRENENLAVLILECENDRQARATLETLPLVNQKLIEFEVIPLIAYPGFERLFAK
jgi:hypothetical protein